MQVKCDGDLDYSGNSGEKETAYGYLFNVELIRLLDGFDINNYGKDKIKSGLCVYNMSI